MNLINLFEYGWRVKALVNSVIQDQSSYYNLLSDIVAARNNIMFSTNNVNKTAWQEIAIKLLRKYFLLIAVGIYLHETQNDEKKDTFIQWLVQKKEVRNLYESINLQHIDNYLSINGDRSSSLTTDLSLGTSGYIQQCVNLVIVLDI